MAEHDSHQSYGSSAGEDVAVRADRPELKQPPMYKVLLLNDNHTPQEFVVHLLKKLFGMRHNRAMDVMLTVHNSGQAVCGTFPFEVAEMKVDGVHKYARHHQYPLMSRMEPDDV